MIRSEDINKNLQIKNLLVKVNEDNSCEVSFKVLPSEDIKDTNTMVIESGKLLAYTLETHPDYFRNLVFSNRNND